MSTFTPVQALKLYILANGISVDPVAEKVWLELYGGPMSLGEYASTSGVCLYTQDNIYMNAPFVEDFARGSEAYLRYQDGFMIVKASLEVPVNVIPVPGFHNQFFTTGGGQQPYTNLGVTHTDRCRISPVGGCAWKCTFCDIPYELKYQLKPKEELLRVVELAQADRLAPARHVLISGGTPRKRDEAWLDEVYAYIAQNSPIPVDVMMPARADMSYPAWLKSVGVNTVSINLEISDPDQALQITPNKARLLGRQHYLDYIERAVEAFGVGGVQSLMVFGSSVEPVKSTLRGVRDLAERGCIPVLSPFRPDFTTPMGKMPPASEQEMGQVYLESLEICAQTGTGVKPGPRCIPCHHNTIAFPDGSPFYIGLEDNLTTA